jgi:hypothetical protein
MSRSLINRDNAKGIGQLTKSDRTLAYGLRLASVFPSNAKRTFHFIFESFVQNFSDHINRVLINVQGSPESCCFNRSNR